MRPYNDNNLYILGAGFSVDAGLPVISTFLSRMRDAVDWLERNGRIDERLSIERVLDFRHESAAAGYRVNIDLDNIEDLFSLAAAQPGIASAEDIRLAIAATLDFSAQTHTPAPGRVRIIESRGWPTTPAWRDSAIRWLPASGEGEEDVESSIYDCYLSTLSGLAANKIGSGQNTIISLNYDLIVEEAARRLNIPFSYGLPRSQGQRELYAEWAIRSLTMLSWRESPNPLCEVAACGLA
ncbi:MAG TPA: hypothetical protein VN699_11625 [Pirellulales bacterium]|nr:hypothetical protein [Pirellulales bacterium]